jgi:hypothetical protein
MAFTTEHKFYIPPIANFTLKVMDFFSKEQLKSILHKYEVIHDRYEAQVTINELDLELCEDKEEKKIEIEYRNSNDKSTLTIIKSRIQGILTAIQQKENRTKELEFKYIREKLLQIQKELASQENVEKDILLVEECMKILQDYETALKVMLDLLVI